MLEVRHGRGGPDRGKALVTFQCSDLCQTHGFVETCVVLASDKAPARWGGLALHGGYALIPCGMVALEIPIIEVFSTLVTLVRQAKRVSK